MTGSSLRILALAAAVFSVSCGHKSRPAPQPVTKPAVTAKPAAPAQGRVSVIDMSALFSLQQSGKVLLYDVRPSFVHGFGHLAGAVSWPRGSFDQDYARHEPEIRAALAADKNVVLYCTDAACPDSRAVAARLAEKGFSVSVLEGGYNAWKDAGMPVE
ncbi:rhodanese-like domain-containing protein [Luteolibacter ambystomatis]|uniref:Rhodanese-like domain-containing protein n=1 Tax=Luteolibacter ambystomatis TaxID=2824561 RepID=A0A975G8D9_9BACT|nr:rhodanese-like domain-containing protein [Luteolibacter ambystomatis]QUE50979.1 rhodanese-like domain-containing protein [Luteolibacter ambystomatis]